MKKSLFTIAAIMLTTGLLTGCGDTQDVSGIKYTPTKFSVDANIIRDKDESRLMKEIHNSNFERPKEEYKGDIGIGEITIDETGTAPMYEISGADIIYEDTTYVGLYDIVNNIQIPYNRESFINFLITSYDIPNETQVFSSLTKYDNIYNEDAESVDISVDEEFSGHTRYNELKAKYGESATWELSLYTYGGNNRVFICGCSKYTFVVNVDSDISIKMQDYIYNLDDILAVESEDNTEETDAILEQTEAEIEAEVENMDEASIDNDLVGLENSESEEIEDEATED